MDSTSKTTDIGLSEKIREETKLLGVPKTADFIELCLPFDPKVDSPNLVKTVNWLARFPEETEKQRNKLDVFEKGEGAWEALSEEDRKAYYQRVLRKELMPSLYQAVRCFNHVFPHSIEIPPEKEKIKEMYRLEEEREKIRQIVMEAVKNNNFECTDIVLRFYREWCNQRYFRLVDYGERRKRYELMRRLRIDIDMELWQTQWDRRWNRISKELRIVEDQEAYELHTKIKVLNCLTEALAEVSPGGKKFIIYQYYVDPKKLEDEEAHRRAMNSPEMQRIREILEERRKERQDKEPDEYGAFADAIFNTIFSPLPTKEDPFEEKLLYGTRGYPWKVLAKRVDPFRAKVLLGE